MATKWTSITLKLAKLIILGFLLGSTSVLIIEHFGKFSYMEEACTDTYNQNQKLSFTRDIPVNTH